MAGDEDEEQRGELERWVYLGQHPSGSHQWRDADGKVLAYTKLKARLPGGLYELEVRRTIDSTTVFPASLRYLRSSDAVDLPTIQARALNWEIKLRSTSLEKRTPRLAEIDEAMAPLLELAGKVIGYANREALAHYVATRIHRA